MIEHLTGEEKYVILIVRMNILERETNLTILNLRDGKLVYLNLCKSPIS
jgi:hypothetical protein